MSSDRRFYKQFPSPLKLDIFSDEAAFFFRPRKTELRANGFLVNPSYDAGQPRCYVSYFFMENWGWQMGFVLVLLVEQRKVEN